MIFIKKVIKSILDVIFPGKCAACGEIIPSEESFCYYCFEMLPKLDVSEFCSGCGCHKKDCLCKTRVFHFSGVTAPFYNDGPAKKAMYNFKFNEKLMYANFFAKSMALAVKTQFYDISFDVVTFVPMPISKVLKRGYNQSRELAVRVAKILSVPIAEKAIGCNKKRKFQHKSDFKERFENVKGMYYPNISLVGKRVLLVDDIKTTGATLDECAKALLKAGANEVYCVTGLITKIGKRKKEGR